MLALIGLLIAVVMAIVGLPPVDLHSPLHFLGIMDPLCGGTRSIRLAALGHWGQAWTYNPLGIVALVVFAMLLMRAGIGLLTGRWYTPSIGWTRNRKLAAIAIIVALAAVLDLRQQSIAPLLMARQ